MSTRRNFLGLTAGAVAAAAAPATTQAAPMNPDAELIRLCEQHLAARNAINASSADLDDPEDAPLWAIYDETALLISNMRPVSLAGLQAKARILIAEATHPDGDLVPEDGIPAYWGWEIANDLLAMGRA